MTQEAAGAILPGQADVAWSDAALPRVSLMFSSLITFESEIATLSEQGN